MSENKRFKIEQALPWSFLGVLFTILVGGPPIYLSLREKATKLTYEVSDYNVLDVHRPLKDLSVLFRGQDIQEKRLNLRVYSINVRNDGDTDIRQTDFDQTMPWGLSLTNARIIDQPRLVYSSSDYIKQNIRPRTVSEAEIDFSKIIVERGKGFTIEVQVLHQATDTPELVPIGKIAGLDSIRVSTANTIKPQLSFWAQVFEGSVGVQLVRVLAYFIGFVIAIALIIWIAFITTDARDKVRSGSKEKITGDYLGPFVSHLGQRGKKLVAEVFERFGGNADVIESFLRLLMDIQQMQKGKKSPQNLLRILSSSGRLLLVNESIVLMLLESEGKSDQLGLNQQAMSALIDLVQFLRDHPLPEDLAEAAKRQQMEEIYMLQKQSDILREKMLHS